MFGNQEIYFKEHLEEITMKIRKYFQLNDKETLH